MVVTYEVVARVNTAIVTGDVKVVVPITVGNSDKPEILQPEKAEFFPPAVAKTGKVHLPGRAGHVFTMQPTWVHRQGSAATPLVVPE